MAGDTAADGRVGPNAVLQVAAALRARGDPQVCERIFAGAGLEGMLAAPPSEMVPEAVVARLHASLAAGLPDAEAEALAFDAGRRTADYLLAHRIPRPAQGVLRALPARLAGRMLLAAVARNAWTFAGSGRFTASPGRPATVAIAANPIAIPGCPWHRGVFEGLFRALVSPRTRVLETACCAQGAPACRFTIDY